MADIEYKNDRERELGEHLGFVVRGAGRNARVRQVNDGPRGAGVRPATKEEEALWLALWQTQ